MKLLKIAAATAALLVSAAASATSLTADYNHWNAKADSAAAKLNGVGIGISTDTDRKHGLYARADYQTDSGVKVWGIEAGYQYSFFNNSHAYALGKIGVGYASADIDGLNADNDFVTVPVGVEVGYKVNSAFNVYGGLGYKWAFNTTENTTCSDGRTTNSAGRGSCSYHGGISRYNDKIGDADGATVRIGLRYNF